MESDDDAPLLTRAVGIGGGLQAGEFHLLHARWATNDDRSDCELSDEENQVEQEIRKASSVKSSLSQEPPLQCSQSLSDILAPVPERLKISRADALNLMREAASAAEAAQKALEKVSGEDFNDASQEELSTRDSLIEKIQRRLTRLREEYRKKKWKLIDPDATFLSTSTYDEIGQLKKGGDEQRSEDPNQKSTQTELSVQSRGVQTEAGKTETPRRPFRKSFDQLKDRGVKS